MLKGYSIWITFGATQTGCIFEVRGRCAAPNDGRRKNPQLAQLPLEQNLLKTVLGWTTFLNWRPLVPTSNFKLFLSKINSSNIFNCVVELFIMCILWVLEEAWIGPRFCSSRLADIIWDIDICQSLCTILLFRVSQSLEHPAQIFLALNFQTPILEFGSKSKCVLTFGSLGQRFTKSPEA